MKKFAFLSAAAFPMFAAALFLASPASAMEVSVVTIVDPEATEAAPGSLVQPVCPGYDVPGDHPCNTAIYHYGKDAKRHAFMTPGAYATWQDGTTEVVRVAAPTLSRIPLGTVIGYRPGSRLIRFESIPDLYAIAADGALRRVTSPEAAAAFYGSDWQAKVETVSDALYIQFTFGKDIVYSSDYDPLIAKLNGGTLAARL